MLTNQQKKGMQCRKLTKAGKNIQKSECELQDGKNWCLRDRFLQNKTTDACGAKTWFPRADKKDEILKKHVLGAVFVPFEQEAAAEVGLFNANDDLCPP